MRVADVIVRSLEAHGIARAYCVPGESYLAVLDALVVRFPPAADVALISRAGELSEETIGADQQIGKTNGLVLA